MLGFFKNFLKLISGYMSPCLPKDFEVDLLLLDLWLFKK